jgi:signal transduction histidine kinase
MIGPAEAAAMDSSAGQNLLVAVTLAASAIVVALSLALARGARARRAVERERDALRSGTEELRREVGAQRARADAERERLEAAERTARAESERSDRARDEFVATVSHELRTPLNAVLGWARLLRLGSSTRPRRRADRDDRAERTGAGADRGRPARRVAHHTGRAQARCAPVELVPVIEAALDAVRPAAARNISIAAVLVPHAGPLAGDPGRLQQVVWNLLANAVKFTPPGGRVEIRLAREGSEVSIRVSDTGAGIDPAFLPHLFERFRQEDSSSTRVHGGLGLGLALVRHLVEAHGGGVSAASDGPGRGARFTVRLPISATRSRHAEAAAATTRPPVELRPLAGLDRVRVLVVDDDPDTLDVVKQVLEAAGAQVTSVASAREALAALSVRPPDVLLSDLGMPGEDGLALIRRSGASSRRAAEASPRRCSPHTQAEDRSEALLAGFDLPREAGQARQLTAAVARLAGRVN